jgi:hypothetical protein
VDIENINGNSIGETVALFQARNTKATSVLIKDGSTGTNIKTIKVFGATVEPIAMAAIGDQSGDAVSEIGVLGVVRSSGAVRVYIVNPVQATVAAPRTFFNAAYTPIAVTRVADLNANSIAEVGVLAMHKTTSQVVLVVKDGMTGATLKTVNYPK